ALTEDDGGLRISVDAERPDGGFLSLTDARATVTFPNGETEEIPLNPSAPGRYDASMVLAAAGPYLVSVDGLEANTAVEHRVVRGWYWSPERERHFQTPDFALLTRLAQMTGGRLLGAADSVFSAERPVEHIDVSSWLILLALS